MTLSTLTVDVLAAIDIVAVNCPSVARNAQKLRQVVRENVANGLIPRRLSILVDNARGEAEFSLAEQRAIGQVLVDLANLQDGKPGPPKEFPGRMNLRISDIEDDALDNISEKTGEDKSEIIRRLIREADPRLTLPLAICVVCGSPFGRKHGRQKICSSVCVSYQDAKRQRGKYQAKRQREKLSGEPE